MSDNRKKYQADVAYEVWRNGGNPDESYDRSYHDYWDGLSVDESASGYLRSRRRYQEDNEP